MNHKCPYKTGNKKCVHKYRKQKVTRRKRFCGYKDSNNCEMYCEWVEMRNSINFEEKSLQHPLKPIKLPQEKWDE